MQKPAYTAAFEIEAMLEAAYTTVLQKKR